MASFSHNYDQRPDGKTTDVDKDAAPAWVTSELIAKTLRVWQPFYAKPLTPNDALEILLSAGQLVTALETGDGEETISRVGAS